MPGRTRARGKTDDPPRGPPRAPRHPPPTGLVAPDPGRARGVPRPPPGARRRRRGGREPRAARRVAHPGAAPVRPRAAASRGMMAPSRRETDAEWSARVRQAQLLMPPGAAPASYWRAWLAHEDGRVVPRDRVPGEDD